MQQSKHHHKEVLAQYKKRQDAAGARLVKKDTGVSIGTNNTIGKPSMQAPEYNGNKVNKDNRLAQNIKPFQDKLASKKVNKNI